MGRNARPRRGAASSGPATAAAPPKKSITTTKQRASKNTGQKTSAQAGRVSKNIHVPKKKRDEEPDDEEQDEDVPKKKGATKRKRDEEPDDEEQDEDDEEAGQDDESDSELSVSGDSDEESEDGDDADGPIDLEEDDDDGDGFDDDDDQNAGAGEEGDGPKHTSKWRIKAGVRVAVPRTHREIKSRPLPFEFAEISRVFVASQECDVDWELKPAKHRRVQISIMVHPDVGERANHRFRASAQESLVGKTKNVASKQTAPKQKAAKQRTTKPQPKTVEELQAVYNEAGGDIVALERKTKELAEKKKALQMQIKNLDADVKDIKTKMNTVESATKYFGTIVDHELDFKKFIEASWPAVKERQALLGCPLDAIDIVRETWISQTGEACLLPSQQIFNILTSTVQHATTTPSTTVTSTETANKTDDIDGAAQPAGTGIIAKAATDNDVSAAAATTIAATTNKTDDIDGAAQPAGTGTIGKAATDNDVSAAGATTIAATANKTGDIDGAAQPAGTGIIGKAATDNDVSAAGATTIAATTNKTVDIDGAAFKIGDRVGISAAAGRPDPHDVGFFCGTIIRIADATDYDFEVVYDEFRDMDYNKVVQGQLITWSTYESLGEIAALA